MKRLSYAWCVFIVASGGIALWALISTLQFFWTDIASEVMTWAGIIALAGALLWFIVNEPKGGGGAGTHRGYF